MLDFFFAHGHMMES